LKKPWRRLLAVTIAGIAVFAGFSIYADVGALGDRLAGFGWWALGAALALAVGNYVVRFIRWTLYLRVAGIKVPPATSALVFVSGFAFSVTPGKIGELVKSFLLRETHGVPITRSAPIVIAERLTDLVALLLLGVVGVAAYGVGRGMVIAGAAVVATGLLVLAWPPLAHRVIRLISRGPLRRFGPRLIEMYDGLIELIRPVRLGWATALGMAAWACECLGFALIVAAFPGTDVPLGLATLIYATTTIAGALSFLPGGLLVTEGTMTLFLVETARGVDQPTAVAATILTRLATLWFAVLLGLLALAALRRVAGAILPP
jgi:glycosyltransferase 2 family protein